jgi:hypothetical protein
MNRGFKSATISERSLRKPCPCAKIKFVKRLIDIQGMHVHVLRHDKRLLVSIQVKTGKSVNT